MGWFGFRKKDNVIDWSEKYKKEQEKKQQASVQQKRPHTYFENLVENMKKQNVQQEAEVSSQESPETEQDEKKQRLGKRLVEIETKLDNISNKIYHLQQRVELLEKKTGVKIEV